MRLWTTWLSSTERSWLGLLLALGLVVRLAGLAATGGLGIHINDEHDYQTLAENISTGRGFAFANGPTSLRPPLYPAFVAGVWTLTGTESLQAVRAAQFVLALATTVIVFGVGRELFGSRAGLLAAALACFYPSLLVANYLLLTEVLFATLLAASTWAIVRLFGCGQLWAALAAGALLALAALTRSVIYPFPIVLALLILTSLKQPLGRRLMLTSAMLLAFAVVLAPWAIRNSRLQGVPVLVDTMGGLNLRMGNYEYTPHDRIWDAISETGDRSFIAPIPERPPDGGQWTEGKKDIWARGLAVQFMVSHPALTAWRSLIKFGDFWGLERDFMAGVQQGLYHPPRAFAVLMSIAILASFPAVLFLAIAGILKLSRQDWPHAFVPLLVVLFVCALHVIVFAHPRYRLPEMPLLCVYAGAALAARPWPVTQAGWRRFAVPAVAAVFIGVWAVQFLWRDWTFATRLLKVAGA